MKNTVQEFKEFINKGNIVEISAAFVMGVAFSSLVSTLVDSIITPFVALVFSIFGIDGNSLNAMSFAINGVDFSYGSVINAIINFIIVSGVLFFIIKFYSKLKKADEETAPTESEIDVLKEIRDNLKK